MHQSHRTPIDALIAAGRLFGASVAVVLPVVLLLEALKAGLLLTLIAAFGEDVGALLGGAIAAMLLATVVGVGALVAIDHHDGHHVGSPRDLFDTARPFLLAFGLGAFVAGLLTAPALLFGVGVAFLTPWMQSARRGETPGVDLRASAKHAAALGRSALIPTVLLLAFYKFSVYLIPALADSAVGRQAPLHLWIPVESLISAFVLPLVAMAIALWYLELDDRHRANPAPAPAPSGPALPGMAPTFVRPARGH